MTDINQLVVDSISKTPSDNVITELTVSQKLGSALGASARAIGSGANAVGRGFGKLPSGVKKGIVVGGGAAALGTGAALGAKRAVNATAAKFGKEVNIVPNNLWDKGSAASSKIASAASQWKEVGKNAAGSVLDAAAKNPHVALGGAGLAGLALINRLRNRRR